jgi:hypothetical protein
MPIFLSFWLLDDQARAFLKRIFDRPGMRNATEICFALGAVAVGLEFVTAAAILYGVKHEPLAKFFYACFLIHPVFFAGAFMIGRVTGVDKKIMKKALTTLNFALGFNGALSIIYTHYGNQQRFAAIGFLFCLIDYVLIEAFTRMPLPPVEAETK